MVLGESKEFLKFAVFCHKLGKKSAAKLEKLPKKTKKSRL